jgi:hypothetical protein
MIQSEAVIEKLKLTEGQVWLSMIQSGAVIEKLNQHKA